MDSYTLFKYSGLNEDHNIYIRWSVQVVSDGKMNLCLLQTGFLDRSFATQYSVIFEAQNSVSNPPVYRKIPYETVPACEMIIYMLKINNLIIWSYWHSLYILSRTTKVIQCLNDFISTRGEVLDLEMTLYETWNSHFCSTYLVSALCQANAREKIVFCVVKVGDSMHSGNCTALWWVPLGSKQGAPGRMEKSPNTAC